MTKARILTAVLLALLGGAHPCRAEGPRAAPERLTLEAAVNRALQNYPGVSAARGQAEAAAAGVDLARTAYFPRTDLLWQENRATRNNVFGLLLPQSVIPPISGPVLGTTALGASAWGSAGGVLVSWEPFDFGLRRATVEAARALKDRADASLALTRLDVAAAAADAFLAALAADQALGAVRATVERMRAFARQVRALTENELRPGADLSRAEAELALARNQLILGEQAVENGRIALAEALGIAGTPVVLDPSGLLVGQPEPPAAPPSLEQHPLAEAAQASVTAARARERAAGRSYYPRFNYQFSLYGRGSGALTNGRIDSGKGIFLDVGNWATGLQVTFPALDVFGIRARRRAEAGNTATEEARYEQVLQGLRAQEARAVTAVAAARGIASNTPLELRAARDTQRLAQARYQSGLATVVEVSEAERLLAQAETDDALARLNTWRATLAEARARGSLEPYLDLVRRSGRP